jgi:uncharacterized membrane protein YdcZ (DUF606 family)
MYCISIYCCCTDLLVKEQDMTDITGNTSLETAAARVRKMHFKTMRNCGTGMFLAGLGGMIGVILLIVGALFEPQLGNTFFMGLLIIATAIFGFWVGLEHFLRAWFIYAK